MSVNMKKLTGCCFAACVFICGCSNVISNPDMNEDTVSGVWLISKTKSKRDGLACELFKDFTAPMIGAKIFSYKQGVAKIVLKTGETSSGFVFVDKSNSSVSFVFDEKTGDSFDKILLPWCKFYGSNVLIADDGTDQFILEKIDISSDILPASIQEKLKKRQGVMLNQLLEKYKSKGYTSSDGKADEPGQQGISDFEKDTYEKTAADSEWRKKHPDKL